MHAPLLKPVLLAIALLYAAPGVYAGKTAEGHGCTTVRPYLESKGRCWHSEKEDGEKPHESDHEKETKYTVTDKSVITVATKEDCKVAKVTYNDLLITLKEEAKLDKDCKEHGEHDKGDRLSCVKDLRDKEDAKKHKTEDDEHEKKKAEHDKVKAEHDDEAKRHDEVKKKEQEKESKAEDECKSEHDSDKHKSCVDRKKKEYGNEDSSDEKKKIEDDKDFEKHDSDFKKADAEYKTHSDEYDSKKSEREHEKERKDAKHKQHEDACKDEHDGDRHERCVANERSKELKAAASDVTESCSSTTHAPSSGGLLPGLTSSDSGSTTTPVPVPLKSRETRQIQLR